MTIRNLVILAIATLLVSCSGGGNGNGGDSVRRRTAADAGTLFLREAGINPDTMLIGDTYTMPAADGWESAHNRWLTAMQIGTLRLDQLCGADADHCRTALLGVRQIDEDITALLLYKDDIGSQLLITTYDSHGSPVDMLDLGTCRGANARYSHAPEQAVEQAVLTFDGRLLIVSRDIGCTDIAGNPLWTAQSSDTYEVDARGNIMRRESSAVLDALPADVRASRQLESLAWYSLADGQALDAIEQALAAGASERAIGKIAYERLLFSPWSAAAWVARHSESPVIPLLSAAAHNADGSATQAAIDAVSDTTHRQALQQALGLTKTGR